jgi:hypothetical protein
MPRKLKIHSLWGDAYKSVGTSAVTLGSDIEWIEAPTKMIRITFKFLSNNTTTGFTVANILTQMGTTFVLQGAKVGKVTDTLQMADLFYSLWFLGKGPPVNFGGTTNNYVCAVIMDYWFGRLNHPNEGLPAKKMQLSWALPADGNEIDTRTVEILQFIEYGAKYTHGICHEQKNGPTPSTATEKNFEFPLLSPNPKDQKVLLDLIFMTTGLGATATDTTTIETLQLMRNGSPVGDKHQVEGWQGMLPANSEDICVIAHTFPKTYVPLDYVGLYGAPLHIRSHGIDSKYGIYFLGGDTNAIRVAHTTLKRW